jgi:hypothetical protein
MRHSTTVLALSAAILLFGCAGAPAPTSSSTSTSSTGSTGSTGQPPIPADTPYVAGNWQFTAMSTIPGNPSLTFNGGITQSGAALTVALHVNGSRCFNQSTTVGFTGTVMPGSTSMTSGSASLTSTALNGQIVTFTGNFTDTTFTGTYSMSGGCAAGDQGSVTGIYVPSIAVGWSGTFTNSAQQTFQATADFIQATTASSDGSFGITGTVAFNTPCVSASTIIPGPFPSGSFILGSLVSFEIMTNNGTVTFTGTVGPFDPTGIRTMSGEYTTSGGSCTDSGTALLYTNVWAY